MSTVNGDGVCEENGTEAVVAINNHEDAMMSLPAAYCTTSSHSVSRLNQIFYFFSSSKIDFDILLQIVGSASHCLKGTKARVQIVFPNCGVNNEILGLHKLVGKQWNLSKFGGRGKRMALSTQCLRSTNGLPLLFPAFRCSICCPAYLTSLLVQPLGNRTDK